MLIMKKYNNPLFIFESILDDFINEMSTNDVTKPVYDVIENDEAYIIEVQLPGINKEDVKIKTENDEILIKAEKKENKDIKYKLKKSYTGKYRLAFEMLKDIDKELIKASMNDGILTITLAKITDPEKLGKKEIKIE